MSSSSYMADPTEQGRDATKRKTKRSGSRFGVIFGVLLLCAAGGAVAVFSYLSNSREPYMARFMPQDTTWYVEMPDPQMMMFEMLSMQSVDAQGIHESKLMDEFNGNIATQFDLSDEDAKSFLPQLMGVAAGARISEGDSMDQAMIFKFTSPELGQKIIASDKLKPIEGRSASGQQTYEIPVLEFSLTRDFERALRSIKSPKTMHLIWYDNISLLVFGSPSFVQSVDAVVSGQELGFDTNEGYLRASRQWQSGASVVSLSDPKMLMDERFTDERAEICGKIFTNFFNYGDPFTLSSNVHPSGFVTEALIPLSGELVPPSEIIPANGEFTLPGRLPKGTIGYHVSRSPGGSLREQAEVMGDYFDKAVARFDAYDAERRERYRAEAEEMRLEGRDEMEVEERKWRRNPMEGTFEGFNELAAMTDAVDLSRIDSGRGEMLIAALYDRPSDPNSLRRSKSMRETFGLLVACELTDEVHQALLKTADAVYLEYEEQLRSEIAEHRKYAAEEGADSADYYRERADRLEARLRDEPYEKQGDNRKIPMHLLSAELPCQLVRINGVSIFLMANEKLSERAIASFNDYGDRLSADQAWVEARAAITQVGAMEAYADTGELIYLMSQRDEFEEARELGLNTSFVKLEGPQRFVSMINLRVEPGRANELTLRVRDLNAPIAGFGMLATSLLMEPLREMKNRQVAGEAETAIGSLKRHLEVYYTEFGVDCPDMATLEADGYVTPGSFMGEFYDTYTWTGAIMNGRYVGDIVATPRVGSYAPEVTITYAADGTASITRVMP